MEGGSIKREVAEHIGKNCLITGGNHRFERKPRRNEPAPSETTDDANAADLEGV